jgi:hypothetical protein
MEVTGREIRESEERERAKENDTLGGQRRRGTEGGERVPFG